MSLILDRLRPERLIDELSPEDLVSALAGMDAWTDERLRTVDYLFCYWTGQFAARQDARSIGTLQSAIGQILERHPAPAPFADRWQALDDALEARRLTLSARDPERVSAMKHVRRILEHLQQEGATRQGELIEKLDLGISISRLSQIVTLMEAHGLVLIERRGRESFLKYSAPVRPGREQRSTRSLLRRGA
jgi:hypothetical protein